jgi:hypothetical protein
MSWEEVAGVVEYGRRGEEGGGRGRYEGLEGLESLRRHDVQREDERARRRSRRGNWSIVCPRD